MGRSGDKGKPDTDIQAGKDTRFGEKKRKSPSHRGATKPLLTEKAVCEYLKRECKKAGLDCFRMSSGVTRIGDRVMRFGQKGMADFLVVGFSGRVLWFECKAKKGRLSSEQVLFARMRKERYQRYFVLRGRDDLYLLSDIADEETPVEWSLQDLFSNS